MSNNTQEFKEKNQKQPYHPQQWNSFLRGKNQSKANKELKEIRVGTTMWDNLSELVQCQPDNPEEQLSLMKLDEIELENLRKVFLYLSNCTPNKAEEDAEFITDEDIKYCMMYFQDLDKGRGRPTPDADATTREIDKEEISLMIWEVDDDLDGRISQEEFECSYKRVLLDRDFLEPRKFQFLVEFLMQNLYQLGGEEGKSNDDEGNTLSDETHIKFPENRFITREDCYKLMYIRYKSYTEVQNNKNERPTRDTSKDDYNSEMEWLFQATPRPNWKTGIRNTDQEHFFPTEKLKLDDFIKRKYEDLLKQREKLEKDTGDVYKNKFKELGEKK